MPMIDLTADQNIPTKAYLAEPAGEVRGGIVLVHEVWGLDGHMQEVAERFAGEGYVALVPDLLSGQAVTQQADQLQAALFDPSKHNEAQGQLRELTTPLHDSAFVSQTLRYLRAAFDILAERADVAERVAVVGFSFGGTYAFQLAAEEPLLKATIAFYGHTPLRDGKLQWITCPVLAFYGERDEGLIKQLPAVEEAMAAANVSFEIKVYETAGHAFFNDANPAAYDETAAEDAWQRTLAFLQRNVANPPAGL